MTKPKVETALITGASRGIGRELALLLGQRGVRLCMAARSGDDLEHLGDEITAAGGPRPHPYPVNLSLRGAASELARFATERLGRVDMIVNNAALMHAAEQVSGDSDEARALLEVNYWSPLALVHELVPAMVARRSGVVVNVTSLAAVMPLRRLGLYAASKSALSAATDALATELRSTGILVVNATFGPVDTALLAQSTTQSGTESIARYAPAGRPAAAARAIVSAVDRGRRFVVYPRYAAPALYLPALSRRAMRFVPQHVVMSSER